MLPHFMLPLLLLLQQPLVLLAILRLTNQMKTSPDNCARPKRATIPATAILRTSVRDDKVSNTMHQVARRQQLGFEMHELSRLITNQ